jgi:hypothetical protein
VGRPPAATERQQGAGKPDPGGVVHEPPEKTFMANRGDGGDLRMAQAALGHMPDPSSDERVVERAGLEQPSLRQTPQVHYQRRADAYRDDPRESLHDRSPSSFMI